MTIRTWLMMLAIAAGAGAGTSQLIESDATTSSCPPDRVCRIGGNCWINGQYHTPCPDDAPTDPQGDPSPELQPPG